MNKADPSIVTANKNSKQIRNIAIWFCLTVFYCYQLMLRLLPNIIRPDLMSNFEISAADFGFFGSMYYIGYVLVHIPVGLALSHYGSRFIMPLFVFFTAVGLLPLIYSPSWSFVVFGRTLTGIGSSAAIVGALQIFRNLYGKRFVNVLGYTVFFAVLTAVFISDPLSEYIAAFGLVFAINTLAIFGLLLALAFYFLMPSRAEESTQKDKQTNSLRQDLTSTLGNRKLLLASFFAGLMVGPLEGFADAWGSAFLTTVYGLDKFTADSTVLAILLGMCIGSLILPFIVEKTEMYYGITILAAFVMVICFSLLLAKMVPISMLYFVMFVIGLASSYQVVAIAKITTYVTQKLSGFAAAMSNMIVMVFGGFYHNAIGLIMEYSSSGQILDGAPLYSYTDFAYSLSVIPLGAVIAGAGFVAISVFERLIKRKVNINSGYA